MRLAIVACLSLLAPATSASAQDPDAALRGRALGQVHDRDGKPWAGAEVVLVSRPIPKNPDIGDEDRVTATTGADGRFTAEVLRGRPYTAWAWGASGPEGRRATSVGERVFVQRPVVLQEARVVRERPLRVTGLEGWKAHAPFEVRMIDECENLQVRWLRVADDGRVTLPPLLGARATVDVFGTAPCRWPITRAKLDAAAMGDVTVELPELRSPTLFVQGSGKPCAGAEVVLRLGESMFTVGATGADGRIRLDVPARTEASPRLVQAFAFADGFLAGHFLPVAFDATSVKPDVPADLAPEDQFATLWQPATSVRARLVGARGEPLAGARVWCDGMSNNRPSPSSSCTDRWARPVTADAAGVLTVTGVAFPQGGSAHLVLRESDYARLPPPWRQGLVPVVFAPLDGIPEPAAGKEPPLVDLRAMCPLELRITDVSGAPAEDVEVNFGSLHESGPSHPWTSESGACADPRGILRILVPGARRLGVQATSGLAMVIRGFETSPGRVNAGPAVLALSLPKPAGVTGQILRKNGEPAADMRTFASIEGRGAGWSPGLDWEYAAEPEMTLADAARNTVRLYVPDADRERALLGCMLVKQVRTDAEGRFRIPLPAEKAQLKLHAAKAGTLFWVESLALDWTGEPQRDVTFRLRFE